MPQADLDDLQDRLRAHPPAAAGARPTTGTTGTPELLPARRGRRSRDGVRLARRRGADERTFPHFITEIDGQTIHFIHVRVRARRTPPPLLLAHTYPGSFVDYLDMIGPLVDPVAHGGRAEDAFDVVVRRCARLRLQPARSPTAGWTTARVAAAYDTLMRRLGYESYGIHGSDNGAHGRPRARAARARRASSACTCCSCSRSRRATRPSSRSSSRRTTPGLEHMQWFQTVGGVQHDERRPGRRPSRSAQSDSPVGAARLQPSCSTPSATAPAWCRSTQILTEVSLDWFANASGRDEPGLPRQRARAEAEPQVSAAPTGVAVFADDFQTIKVFAERDNTNIVHWSRFEEGRALRRARGPRRRSPATSAPSSRGCGQQRATRGAGCR